MQKYATPISILLLCVSIVVGAFLMRPVAVPFPSPVDPIKPTGYAALVATALQGESTGTADEFFAAAFDAAADRVASDPGNKFQTRQDFQAFIDDLGNSIGAEYPVNLGPIITTAFGWIDNPGNFTPEDRHKATNALTDIAGAFDAY